MEFSEKLINLRKEKGLSQEELGEKLNVARQTVSKWELGETTPEMEKLVKLSDIFEVSLDSLIKEEEEKVVDLNSSYSNNNNQNNTNTQKLAGIVIVILKIIGVFIIASILLIIISIILFVSVRQVTMSEVTVESVDVNERMELMEEYIQNYQRNY